MKSLIATLLLLLCILALSGINFYHVNSVVRELEKQLDSLPSIEDPECTARAEALYKYWEEKEKSLEISIPYLFIDRIFEQAALLSTCASIGDLYGFYSAKALLSDAVGDLARNEQILFGILF